MDEKFPTCALAVIDFQIEKWRDVVPGLGELDAFVRPKDLDEA
jgi:phosphohistidine phosphatase